MEETIGRLLSALELQKGINAYDKTVKGIDVHMTPALHKKLAEWFGISESEFTTLWGHDVVVEEDEIEFSLVSRRI